MKQDVLQNSPEVMQKVWMELSNDDDDDDGDVDELMAAAKVVRGAFPWCWCWLTGATSDESVDETKSSCQL